MPATAATQASPNDRYIAHLDEARNYAQRILNVLNADPYRGEAIHWGHVGDMACAADALKETCDQLERGCRRAGELATWPAPPTLKGALKDRYPVR